MSELPPTPTFPPSGPRLTAHQVEYRVREVKRYVLTRFESQTYEDGRAGTRSQSYGDFDNFNAADRTGRLVAAGERASAWEGSDITFTDALGVTIRLNTDGTSTQLAGLASDGAPEAATFPA